MRVRIVAGSLGNSEIQPLASAFRSAGWEVSEQVEVMPETVSGSAVTEAYLRQERAGSSSGPWDLVVGLQEGSGFAAHLASMSQVSRTVLVDPDLTVLAARAPEVIEHLPDSHWQLATTRAEALEPYADEFRSGRLSEAALVAAFGGPDSSLSTRAAIAVTRFAGHRFTTDYDPPADVTAAADWFESWSTPSSNVEVWLPMRLQPLAPHLARFGEVRVLATDLAWLDDPDALVRVLLAGA